MRLKALLSALAIAAGALFLSGTEPAFAQRYRPLIADQGQEQQQATLSVREAIEIVRRRFGGEPIGSPQPVQAGGRRFYILTWRFPNEVVDTVRVDAVTGEVSR